MDVRKVNALTAAWLRQDRSEPGVISGAGLWPLLAVLAASADEPGRTELAEAVGMRADDCMDAAHEVLKTIGEADGVDAAVGIWTQAAAQVDQGWRASLPPANTGELTGVPASDQRRLDAWAHEHTRGLVERFPVEADPDMMLILATALSLRTTWTRSFSDEPVKPKAGPWAKRRLAGLQRTSPELDEVSVVASPAGALTISRIEGDNGLDVHLVLGEEGRAPAAVLPSAVSALSGEGSVRSGSEILDSGTASSAPGLAEVRAQRRGVTLSTVRFTVRSQHDLLAHAKVFGLQTVSQSGRGHFSRIGPVPLRVDQARQAAVAIFSATGFEAAAVTGAGLRLVSLPVLRDRGLHVTYDRPFGFLAVHRVTGLVLFAGWVDTAESWSR